MPSTLIRSASWSVPGKRVRVRVRGAVRVRVRVRARVRVTVRVRARVRDRVRLVGAWEEETRRILGGRAAWLG